MEDVAAYPEDPDLRARVEPSRLRDAEIPFDNEMVVVRMRGRVVAEAIAASQRHAPHESGGFLQVDDRVTLDPARAHPERIPPEDSGRSIRRLLVDVFAVAIWKQLGGFDAVDADHDGKVTPADVVAALVVRALDTIEVDGVISREEADAVD